MLEYGAELQQTLGQTMHGLREPSKIVSSIYQLWNVIIIILVGSNKFLNSDIAGLAAGFLNVSYFRNK